MQCGVRQVLFEISVRWKFGNGGGERSGRGRTFHTQRQISGGCGNSVFHCSTNNRR
uniref:Uncharacterized protein n=1 Tax=Anguilla anguilla TaxID=7936 RepID=A0A0E9Q8E5_ANGAN